MATTSAGQAILRIDGISSGTQVTSREPRIPFRIALALAMEVAVQPAVSMGILFAPAAQAHLFPIRARAALQHPQHCGPSALQPNPPTRSLNSEGVVLSGGLRECSLTQMEHSEQWAGIFFGIRVSKTWISPSSRTSRSRSGLTPSSGSRFSTCSITPSLRIRTEHRMAPAEETMTHRLPQLSVGVLGHLTSLLATRSSARE